MKLVGALGIRWSLSQLASQIVSRGSPGVELAQCTSLQVKELRVGLLIAAETLHFGRHYLELLLYFLPPHIYTHS